MKKKLGKRFFAALLIFGLVGQVAWVVENMYFNVFIYKMFHASAADISFMVGASAAAATLTTIFMGALSDFVGKRKLFICGGYILWGISILSFALIRMDILTPIAGGTAAAASLGITLVILMDCVMTFFGSTANDAAFNAWMTDKGDESNRGKIEGLNSMMPLIAILVVFGGFMAFDLDKAESWTMIYLIIGGTVTLIGFAGAFLIEESAGDVQKSNRGYWHDLIYSFRPSVIRKNQLLYVVIGAFAVFGISIQIFMPYLILYYEKSLGMENYVLIMAPAIILAAIITAFYGKLYDKLGFQMSVIPVILILMLGYVLLFFGTATLPVFLGSLFMMTGYLSGMAVFGAMIRSHIPEHKAGQFQGIRIIGQVLIPGMIGPAIGAAVLHNAEQIVNSDGTTSFLPNRNIFLAAFLAAALLLIVVYLIFLMMRNGHYRLKTKRTGNSGSGESFSEYPRPQMKREEWFSLNGEWSLNGASIRVPFPPQSELSGYGKHVGKHLTYEKKFVLPEKLQTAVTSGKKRAILHFGAVDQIAEVMLNGTRIGRHEDGYLAFSYDITEALASGENTLTVKATDKLSKVYPYGKQRKDRGGMWYTPISGIWQSVWLETVPEHYMEELKLQPDLNGVTITVKTNKTTESTCLVKVVLSNGETLETSFSGNTGRIELKGLRQSDGSSYEPKLWTPETPYLYRATITMEEDTVETYFALRTIRTEKVDGVPRVLLNDKPVFLHGVLDQGYYPDGIFLPPTEAEYEQDILRMKELGLNLLRKHIKVEPECFYYYCDLHGMLVLQDMVNSGKYSFLRDTALPTVGTQSLKDTNRLVSKKRRTLVEYHMQSVLKQLYNHPCVVGYTIFNEGWGQFDSDDFYSMLKEIDPSRLYDSTSGWFTQEKSDFDSRHIYFTAKKLSVGEKPLFVSECGGYSYTIPEHIYGKYGNYGYGSCESKKELTDRIEEMYETMILPSINEGLCGCIYTQLSDVEDETNGFYTYDRECCKVDVERMKKLSEKLKQQCAEKG